MIRYMNMIKTRGVIIDMELCNCGREGRYFHTGVEETFSCNKYNVCLPYDDLYNKVKKLEKQHNIMKTTLGKIVEFDQQAYTYRAWADEALVNITK